MNKKSKDKALIFGPDRTVTIYPILDQSADVIETGKHVLYLEGSQAYVDTDGSIMYLFDLSEMPARVEAENLKKLRRSVALRRIFEFERSTGGIDWLKLFPYLIIALLVIFR